MTQQNKGLTLQKKGLTLVTFGFKYGLPNTNYYFDVSFLTNPARQKQWSLFSKPGPEMCGFVLSQPACQAFLDKLTPLLSTVVNLDDDCRVGIGCSAGRHRSQIVAEELKKRLEAEGLIVRLIHREEQYWYDADPIHHTDQTESRRPHRLAESA